MEAIKPGSSVFFKSPSRAIEVSGDCYERISTFKDGITLQLSVTCMQWVNIESTMHLFVVHFRI